ncbi:MAG: hypothetical protein K0S29_923 [Gammaproteobacteria bacterium]|nr:hypothetical protein [Gammaproteobacteria bacterium]
MYTVYSHHNKITDTLNAWAIHITNVSANEVRFKGLKSIIGLDDLMHTFAQDGYSLNYDKKSGEYCASNKTACQYPKSTSFASLMLSSISDELSIASNGI